MEGDFIKINYKLLPLSWLYGLGVGFRNMLFDIGLLKSRSFDVPMIAVGNITVGGTGKTPHTEYLVTLLKDKFKVAVISRGYKRKTHGFVLADSTSTAREIGDEPYQMLLKYGDNVTIAVDGKRSRGVDILTSDTVVKDIDVVLLDDAFQHRYVKPGINILLVDYHRLILYDKLLPAGRLREPLSGKNRADIVIVTKCPKSLKPMEFRVITKAMELYPYQQLYFTTLDYGDMYTLFGDERRTIDTLSDTNVLLLTGIASPKQMNVDLTPRVKSITPLTYGDHHAFKTKDIKAINATFAGMAEPKMVITTEKDAARLRNIDGLDENVRKALYVLPVRIRFMLGQEERFNDKIIGYVRKNSRNSILVKGKDDNKSSNGHNTRNRPRTISFRDNR